MLAVALMYIDQRKGWLESARYGLQAAAYPVQVAANSPSSVWHALRDWLRSRDTLRAELARLEIINRDLALRAQRVESLERENARLREFGRVLPPLVKRWQVVSIIASDLTSLRQRLVIAQGAGDGVFKGQAVLSTNGVLGQVLRVGPFSAEVMLLTDPEHAMPVMVARNGLRTLAVGGGTTRALTLPFLPAQSDIQEGDLLVSSGLGGIYPAGFPVAKVTRVRRESDNALAQIDALLESPVNYDRQVAIVWFDPANPAATAQPDLPDEPPAQLAAEPPAAPGVQQ